MLHGMINEQGHWLDERDDILEKKMIIFYMFSYKSLASGALMLGINSSVIIKPVYLCYRCYK